MTDPLSPKGVWRRTVSRVVALAVALMVVPTSAHHGFRGRYDVTRLLLVEGVIREWRSDRVHVEFEVETGTADVTAAAHRFDVLERVEARPLRLHAIAAGQRVRVEVDPILSRRIAANPPLPEVGDRVRFVAHCRFSDDDRRGWLRVMAIERADSQVWTSNRRSYHVVPDAAERASVSTACPS